MLVRAVRCDPGIVRRTVHLAGEPYTVIVDDEGLPRRFSTRHLDALGNRTSAPDDARPIVLLAELTDGATFAQANVENRRNRSRPVPRAAGHISAGPAASSPVAVALQHFQAPLMCSSAPCSSLLLIRLCNSRADPCPLTSRSGELALLRAIVASGGRLPARLLEI